MQLPRLVDRLAGQAEVGDGRQAVPVRNGFSALPVGRDFAPLLCRIVLTREPTLGLHLDLCGVCIGPGRGTTEPTARVAVSRPGGTDSCWDQMVACGEAQPVVGSQH